MINRVKIKLSLNKYLRKLSLIEYFVLFWLILFAGHFYYKNSRHTETIYIDLIYSNSEWMTSPTPPKYWQTSSIKIGDPVRNSSGKQFAQITSVERSYWSSDRQYIFLTLKAQALFNKNSNTYQIGNNTLLIGSQLKISLDKTTFNGTIFDIYFRPDQQFNNFEKATATITVKYLDLSPEHAKSITNFSQTDSQGKSIVKLLSFKDLPSDKVVTTSSGEVLLRKHPLNRDVILTLELSDVLCSHRDCFFNKVNPLKIGSQIWFASETTLLHPNENATFDPHQGIITSLSINRHDK